MPARSVAPPVHADVSTPSRAQPWIWARVILLAANVGWTVLGLGGYRSETKVVTYLLTAALLVFDSVATRLEGRSRRWTGSDALLAAFLAYATLNVMVVSPVGWLGWLDWLGWANAMGILWVVKKGIRGRRPREALVACLIGLGVVAVGLACYQRFVNPEWLMLGREQALQFVGRSSGPMGIPNSLAGLLILLLPLLVWRTLRPGAPATSRIASAWLAAVFGFGLFLTLSRGAWLALAAAAVLAPWVVAEWSGRKRLGWSAACLAASVALLAAPYFASPAARDRIDQLVHHSGELSRPMLWRGAWQLFRAQPVTGTGAGSYNVLFERHRPAGFNDEPQWAHNDYLNTLSDYGAAGLLLLAGGVALLARGPRRAAGSIGRRRALGVGLLAFAFQDVVEFHLHLPALAMMAAVLGGVACEEDDSLDAKGGMAGWSGGTTLATGLLGVALGWGALTFVRADALRELAREEIGRHGRAAPREAAAVLDRAAAALDRAVRLAPRHAQAWADRAFVEELQLLAAPGAQDVRAAAAEASARKALALAPVVPGFWIRLGVALDLQGRRDEARLAFRQALELAPRMSAAWYYYAFHLSRATNERAAALGAVATCLSLDPGNTAAEALRAKLSARP